MRSKNVMSLVAAMVVSGSATALDVPTTAPGEATSYSAYARQDFPNQVLFGDTHLHTAYSTDAGMAGTTLTPDDAYRFAKGETVTSSTGIEARLGRPLDWLAVTDHAENLGLPIALKEQDASLLANQWGREMAELFAQGTVDSARGHRHVPAGPECPG